ncbi:MAG: hypothetical protein LBC73_07460 [Oscillospiraceae bacterium]|jgi:peptide maturation system protein (TIGR04066 family)|nr:hypothetical protein [Oscillospiraceae bacterium]
MKTPVALYPFVAELLPIVRHFNQLQEQYAITELISPQGFGLSGKDAGFVCNHRDIGLTITNEAYLHMQWETLIISECVDTKIIDDKEFFNEIAKSALESNKKVSYYGRKCEDIPKHIFEFIDLYKSKINIHTDDKMFLKNDALYKESGNINAPIILIGGLLKEADVLEVLVQLYLKLSKDSLSVTVITREPICTMFGFYNINHILMNKDIIESEKIHAINLYIAYLERLTKPDIIIIEAPDAVMQYSEFVHNGYGILTQMLCHAISPDYFICCLPFIFGVEAFINAISEDFNRRYGIPISVVHLSNVLPDTIDMLQQGKLSYTYVNLELVCNQIEKESKNFNIKMINVLESGVDEIVDLLMNGV